MQKSNLRTVLKTITKSLLYGTLFSPVLVNATTYSTLYSTIFNNSANSAGIACTDCHNSSLVGAVDRHSSPEDTDGAGPITGADFDVYALAAARVGTMVLYTDPANYAGDAYMPMDPLQADFTYIGVADLNPAWLYSDIHSPTRVTTAWAWVNHSNLLFIPCATTSRSISERKVRKISP